MSKRLEAAIQRLKQARADMYAAACTVAETNSLEAWSRFNEAEREANAAHLAYLLAKQPHTNGGN